jgi:hypothetical protein
MLILVESTDRTGDRIREIYLMPFNMSAEKRQDFFEQELHRLSSRNEKLSALFRGSTKRIEERLSKRHPFITVCMDERTFNTEEALGLLPGEGYVFGSGGARLSSEDFSYLYADDLKQAADRGAVPVVYLITHLCGAGKEFGCAAFKTDVDAQRAYFEPLQKEYKSAHPEFMVHVLMHDTKTDRLEAIVRDENDAGLDEVLAGSYQSGTDRIEDFAHAAYGVYIGDAYRGWVDNYNEYFRLAADDPNLSSDLGIAFAVMMHHSTVDLETKPMILHVDYPAYESEERTERARANMDRQIKEALRVPEIIEQLAGKRLRVIKTKTDMGTWMGKSHGEPNFE